MYLVVTGAGLLNEYSIYKIKQENILTRKIGFLFLKQLR